MLNRIAIKNKIIHCIIMVIGYIVQWMAQRDLIGRTQKEASTDK